MFVIQGLNCISRYFPFLWGTFERFKKNSLQSRETRGKIEILKKVIEKGESLKLKELKRDANLTKSDIKEFLDEIELKIIPSEYHGKKIFTLSEKKIYRKEAS